jgi:hypothetical protein
MSIFKTTDDIFKFPWNYTQYDSVTFPPDFIEWDYSSILDISEVVVWEELYYEAGNFGIYVSWNPRAEYYIIVYDLLIGSTHAVEEYYGHDAENKIKLRARELGIILKENQVWINPKEEWLYNSTPPERK